MMSFCPVMYKPPSDAKAAAVEDLSSANNIVLISYATLKEAKKCKSGPPFCCRGCESALCNYSKLLTKSEYQQKMAEEEFPFPEDLNDAQLAQAEGREKAATYSKGKFLKDLTNSERGWICEFCEVHNRVPKEMEIPKTEDQLYLVKKGKNSIKFEKKRNNNFLATTTEEAKTETLETQDGDSKEDETNVIFCIDISGSMKELHEVQNDGKITYSSRIKLISEAILKQIETMKKSYPNRKVGFVLFNSSVQIHGDFTSSSALLQSDFDNFNKMFSYAKLKGNSLMTSSLKKSFPTLKHKVATLEKDAKGSTALGPGLVCALGLASQTPGSRVILCTDGLANVGLGSFNGMNAENAAKTFYNQVGDVAVANGVSVSIITVQGNVCRVDALGPLTDRTGGTITRVDPSNLDLSDVATNDIIATNVHLKVIMHEALTFQNEDSANLHNNKSILTKNVGSVTESNEVYFEYRVKSNQELKNEKMSLEDLDWIPLQSQITYTDLQGNEYIRVICKKQELTRDQDEVHKGAKAEVLANYVQVQNANLVLNGKVNEAKAKNNKWANVMDKMGERKGVDMKNQQVIQEFQKNQKQMQQLIQDSEDAQKNQKSSVEKDEINSQWYKMKQQKPTALLNKRQI